MAKKVLKFGGTSVGSIERIQHVANIIKKEHDASNKIIVVVSAMSGKTNELLKHSESVSKNFNKRDEPIRNQETQLASHSTKSHIIQMFLSIMSYLNIITNKNRKSLTQNVHIIFNKSKFSKNEADLLLGVLSSIEKALKK